MAIVIYKYAYHVGWDTTGVAVSGHGGMGGTTDLSNYYTIQQLQTPGLSHIHFANITEAYHNYMLGLQGGLIVGDSDDPEDSSGVSRDDEFYHLDFDTYSRVVTWQFSDSLIEESDGIIHLVNDEYDPGPGKYYGTADDSGSEGIKGWFTLPEGIEDIYVVPDNQFPIDYLYYSIGSSEFFITDIPKADGVVSGGIVSWLTGLQFQLSPTAYYINGTLYTIASDTVTLDAADATYDRFDILVVDINQDFTFVKGTASSDPLKPTPDVLTQIELTSIYIPALATEPDPLPIDEFIYSEYDSEEWTASASGVAVIWDYDISPYNGTYCANAGLLTNGDYFLFEYGSSQLDRANYETFILNLKLKATIPNTANRFVLEFLSDGVPVTNQYTLSFDRTSTAWQNIGVSISALTWYDDAFNQVRLTWLRTGGGSYDGIYLDYIKLEINIEQPVIQQSIELMGDVNGSGLTGSPVITELVTIPGLVVGQYGDATHIPMVTVDVKGRVTAIEEVAFTPGGDTLWEETTDDFITPVSSTGTGIIVDDVYIKDNSIYRPDGHLNHLTVQAGDAVGATNDGGDLTLKAGNAVWGDSGSLSGNLYLVPGSGYSSANYGTVYFGDSNYKGVNIAFRAMGSETNVGLQFYGKGSGNIYIGDGNPTFIYLNSSSNVFVYSRLTCYKDIYFSAQDSMITGGGGSAGHPVGYHITVRGGAAYSIGDNAGGNVYIYGGTPNGTGIRGDVYIGSGSAGYLPAATTETYVVYYNTSTGLLSYGYVGEPGSPGGYTFSMSIDQASDDSVTLVNDEDSPGNSQYYGTDGTGTKGWFALPEGGGSLWEETTDDFITPVSSTGTGIIVDDVYIKDNSIYRPDGHLNHLTVQAGDAVGATNDGGDLTLKAGDAVWGDVNSTSGYLYLVPGSPYQAISNSIIYFGNASFAGAGIYLQATGSSTNVSLYFRPKGAGGTTFGITSSNLSTFTGNISLYQSVTFNSTIGQIVGMGVVGSNGGDLTFRGGDTITTSYSGGNLYLYGGAGVGTGHRGYIYFGNGSSIATLPVVTSDTNVVYYNTTTGLLSYGPTSGIPGTTYTFSMSLAESGGTVTLDNDSDTPGNSQYYGTDGTGTKGWFALPEGGGSLWEETTDDFITPISSTGTGIIVDDIYIKDNTIYRPDGSLKHLTVQAGDASGSAGTDGGNVYLRAGNAIWGDSGSVGGFIYLISGEGYEASQTHTIYLGDNSTVSTARSIQCAGSPSNINLSISAKGTGSIYLGSDHLNINSTRISLGYNLAFDNYYKDYSIYCVAGYSSHPTGYNLSIYAGAGYGTGDNAGGNVYIYGGAPNGAGLRGDVYFGSGSAGYLPEADSEDVYVVRYNPSTGKLSYAAV
jgi:hypothetical protein